MTERKHVIPVEMLPSICMEEVPGLDGKPYLVRNDVMFTAYKHSQGEFSEFFLALRDECKILANRCPKCGHLICPPFQQRCPTKCNFIEMQPEEITDIGVMVASPAISLFAPSRFKDQVPYGEGDVYLKDKNGKLTNSALSVRVRTTRGMIMPGIFKKGTRVKVVFCDKRLGQILDIFVVPQSELTKEQIEKSPLMESDLSWVKLQEPSFEEPTEEMVLVHNQVIDGFKTLPERIKRSPRAQKDLANWSRKIKVKTGGGEFSFIIENGQLQVFDEVVPEPDLILAVKDPFSLLPWLERGTALTNLFLDGILWVSKLEETIFRLDRLPRSLRRDNC